VRTEDVLIKKDKEAKPKRKPVIGFKADPDVVAYFEECARRGLSTSEAAHKIVRFTRDAEAESGDTIHDKIEQLADSEGLSVGRMYGRLAVLGLKTRR
jgi:hypothetical protein